MLGEDDDEDAPGTFNSASVWGRISVVAAGPIFNFILAFIPVSYTHLDVYNRQGKGMYRSASGCALWCCRFAKRRQ